MKDWKAEAEIYLRCMHTSFTVIFSALASAAHRQTTRLGVDLVICPDQIFFCFFFYITVVGALFDGERSSPIKYVMGQPRT